MKIFILFLVMGLFISFRSAYACSCLSLDLDYAVSDSNHQIFTGTIEKILSKTKIIVKVDQNLSGNTINQYVLVTLQTEITCVCGVDFSEFYTNQVLVVGRPEDGKISTDLCSLFPVYNDNVYNVKFEGITYENVPINQVTDYLTSTYTIGEINTNKMADLEV